MKQKKKIKYSPEELYNPKIDLNSDACAYGRQSTIDQVLNNIESYRSQTILLLEYIKVELDFRDDGTTGKVTLFVENQVVDDDGNINIKNASGTWPIDRRPGLQAILDLINGDKIKLVVVEYVDRLFRDEDRIDSNIFIKACKEHNCYVHVSSKRMTYNFANPQHADFFRMEVQMAAAYIENHVKGTMLTRREQKHSRGYWAGCGAIPVNFIVDKREDSPTYGKLISYKPHSEISATIYDRMIELGFDIESLCTELATRPYIYPDFEKWTKKEYIARVALKPVPDGYTISREGLEYMLCNIANIGAVMRDGKIVMNNHDAIVDETRFWLVYDHLRYERPDGKPTGKPRLVRYTQTRNKQSDIKPLFKPTTSLENCTIHFDRGEGDVSYYHIVTRTKLKPTYLVSITANQVEEAIVERMFYHIRNSDLGDFKKQQSTQKQRYLSRLTQIASDLAVVEEELNALDANLKILKIPAVITRTEASMQRALARQEELEQERENIRQTIQDIPHKSFEEELAGLEEKWEEKPFEMKKSLLELVVKSVVIDKITPRFFKVSIEWSYKEWGIEERIFEHTQGGSKQWSKEELEILIKIYPTATERATLMKELPNRVWHGIHCKAKKMRIMRTGPWKDSISHQILQLSWHDLLWLQEKGMSYQDFSACKLNSWSRRSCL